MIPGILRRMQHCFFTLASCDPSQHLDNMSRLAELMSNEELMEELKGAKTPEDLLALDGKYLN